MDIQAIHNQAYQAAVTAENNFLASHGEMAYCGFAWCEVYVTRTNSAVAKALLSVGFRKSWKPKCLTLWKPGAYHGQSMDVLEAGAMAYAAVLEAHGIRAYMGSRAD